MEVAFWASISFIFYTYFFYPLALFLGERLRKSHLDDKCANEKQFDISVIVSVHNEEESILRCIKNVLEQDDGFLKEIIIGSDGSTDHTVDLVKSLEDPRVRLLDFPEKRGRALVHNDCAAAATGDILVFIDAETQVAENFLANISRPFQDTQIGCVVGQLRWRNEAETSETVSQGLYWRYELWIRSLESRLEILATGTGACMAVRKSLYRPLPPDEDVDFATPLDVILQGYRVYYQPKAIATDVAPASIRGIIRSHSRMTAKNLRGTLQRIPMLFKASCYEVTWGIISHKILRWCTPLFLIGLFVSSAFLIDHLMFRILFVLQVAGYILAIVGGLVARSKNKATIMASLYNFLVANAGMLWGLAIFLSGRRIETYGKPE